MIKHHAFPLLCTLTYNQIKKSNFSFILDVFLICLLAAFPQTESSHGGAAPAAVPLHRMAFTHLPFLERDPRVPAKSPVRRGDNHQGQQPGRTDARALQVRIHGHF